MAEAKRLDRRIARTRRALGNALIALVLESGYDQISIRELTERADIGYATFFRHYKSKDDLLSQLLVEAVEDFFGRLQPRMTVYDEALTLYKFVEERREIFAIAVKVRRSNPATVSAWKRIDELTLARYTARETSGIPLDVSINHVLRSLWESIRWWLKDGAHYSPEQMAAYHAKLIVEVAKDLAIDPRGQPEDKSSID